MQATAVSPAIPTTNDGTTLGLPSSEPLVVDVTADIIGERREEWRDGYDAGMKAGARRVIESSCLESITVELVLLREAAKKLGEKADFWMRRAEDMELEATHWHGLIASFEPSVGAAPLVAQEAVRSPAGGSI